MPIFIVRTTAGRERQVVDKLAVIASKQGSSIKAILSPSGIRGYLIVEAEGRDDVVEAVHGIGYAKGVMEKSVDLASIEHFIIAVPQQITVKEGDIVELVSGPFKGEKAKVNRINVSKEEVVIELLEAAVPIPLRVSIDSIRVIQSVEEPNIKTGGAT